MKLSIVKKFFTLSLISMLAFASINSAKASILILVGVGTEIREKYKSGTNRTGLNVSTLSIIGMSNGFLLATSATLIGLGFSTIGVVLLVLDKKSQPQLKGQISSFLLSKYGKLGLTKEAALALEVELKSQLNEEAINKIKSGENVILSIQENKINDILDFTEMSDQHKSELIKALK